MRGKNKKNRPVSQFRRQLLNNQVVAALSAISLILLIVFLFTEVSYLFAPIRQFLATVGLPVILAGILYYLMNPVVDYSEEQKVPELYSVIGLLVLVIALIAWGSVVIVPEIQEQTASFISNFPQYVDTIDNKLVEILQGPLLNQLREQLETAGDEFTDSAGDMIQDVSENTVQGFGSFVGTVATILMAPLMMPSISFYLLEDGKQLAPYSVKSLPARMQRPTLNVLSEMNSQVSFYIRGQLAVAFAVVITFMIGFAVTGLEYAVILGITADFLDLISYLGPFLAMVPAIFLAIVAGPFMVIRVLIVFVIEQTIEGRLIFPLVLGNRLVVHPVTILLVLLTSGKSFGATGAILGILVYVAAKVVTTHVFEWYTIISSLYEENPLKKQGEQQKETNGKTSKI